MITVRGVLFGKGVPSVPSPAQNAKPGLIPGFIKIIHPQGFPSSQKVLGDIPPEKGLVAVPTGSVGGPRHFPIRTDVWLARTFTTALIAGENPLKPSSSR